MTRQPGPLIIDVERHMRLFRWLMLAVAIENAAIFVVLLLK